MMRALKAWTMAVAAFALCAAALGQQQQQGGCYDTDANGKQIFVPNCGLKDEPTRGVTGATGSTGAASAAKRFPYPGADGAQGATGATGSSATKRFPYPGSDAAGATQPDAPSASPLKDAGSSGESSSSSSSSSSEPDPVLPGDLPAVDDDAAAKAAEARHAARNAPRARRQQSADDREAEDLRVADFYFKDGNFRGSYMRAQDAVQLYDDDPNAHCMLAQSARKLGKLDEAVVHYRRCLELDPVPDQKKAAERALKEMAGK